MGNFTYVIISTLNSIECFRAALATRNIEDNNTSIWAMKYQLVHQKVSPDGKRRQGPNSRIIGTIFGPNRDKIGDQIYQNRILNG
ncbi:hypothetical protein AYI69_g8911 [Smittium culicis]|uniref:Uncharacterized protein n=1 Tax=Smittium culicis TaxID=133412 RepID=A0A1R1XGC6_9FUNG|nr:hypothetical protein AYI69_g8911 [Smittium culicis]